MGMGLRKRIGCGLRGQFLVVVQPTEKHCECMQQKGSCNPNNDMACIAAFYQNFLTTC